MPNEIGLSAAVTRGTRAQRSWLRNVIVATPGSQRAALNSPAEQLLRLIPEKRRVH